MNLPERFDISYIDENNTAQRPVMIHRAILGSFERFVAILIEHFNGEFPIFIAPTQVIFVPIAEEFLPYTKELCAKMLEFGAYGEVNLKGDSFNKRIRTSEKQKVPFVAIIGRSEVEKGEVAICDRITKTQYNLTKEAFLDKLKNAMSEGYF